MRVMLSTYGSRGAVKRMPGLAAQLRILGAEVRVCARDPFIEPDGHGGQVKRCGIV
jgi:UDP:flavonoid glycosyltransferase YjiC (YdhE family)